MQTGLDEKSFDCEERLGKITRLLWRDSTFIGDYQTRENIWSMSQL